MVQIVPPETEMSWVEEVSLPFDATAEVASNVQTLVTGPPCKPAKPKPAGSPGTRDTLRAETRALKGL